MLKRFHEVMKPRAYLRERGAEPGRWAGDVWKTAAILKSARPELKIVAYDAPPTGLVAVTNLDASSTPLEERYFALVEQWAEVDLYTGAADYYESLDVRSFEQARNFSAMSAEFWP